MGRLSITGQNPRQDRKRDASIVVADEGAGFTPNGSSAGRFGLFGIRERTGFFGGEMRIESAPGKGTRVTLTLPRR
jgi:signal transduction histidine kinase